MNNKASDRKTTLSLLDRMKRNPYWVRSLSDEDLDDILATLDIQPDALPKSPADSVEDDKRLFGGFIGENGLSKAQDADIFSMTDDELDEALEGYRIDIDYLCEGVGGIVTEAASRLSQSYIDDDHIWLSAELDAEPLRRAATAVGEPFIGPADTDGLSSTDHVNVFTVQRTLKTPIGCVGIGLHTGLKIHLRLLPAPAGHGIVFRRTDLGVDIPARFDRVVDTRLCTVLGHEADPFARVGTVEHLMAALFGSGIDNVLVEVDGPELPILDGSASPYLFLIDCAGSVEQDAPRTVIRVERIVRVAEGAAWAELRPLGARAFEMAISIAFTAEVIGSQALSLRLTQDSFRRELAAARTFVMADEIERLRECGLARGGSLDNAVVVDGAKVLNPAGLRCPDEFVRHKLLGAVGDLALAGATIHGRFVANKSGHTLNNRLLRALFMAHGAARGIDSNDVVNPSVNHPQLKTLVEAKYKSVA